MLKLGSPVLSCVIFAQQFFAQVAVFDPQTLAREAHDNGAATYARMKDYSVHAKISYRMFDENRRVKRTLIYDSPAPPTRKDNESGYRAFILVEKDGKPIADDKIQQQREKNDKQIDKLERKQALQGVEPDSQPGYLKFGAITFGKGVMLSPSTILSKCVFSGPDRTTIEGRGAIRLDFASCSAEGVGKNEAYVAKLQGRVWIDEENKILARLEGWIVESGSPGATSKPLFIYEQTKVDENWFPRKAVVDGSAPFLIGLLIGFKGVEFTIEFSDYKRYTQ